MIETLPNTATVKTDCSLHCPQESQSLEICTSLAPNDLDYFELVMASGEAVKDCECKPNCEEVVYKTQVEKLKKKFFQYYFLVHVLFRR